MLEYLNDKKFLSLLDESRIQEHYVKIIILDFSSELAIKEIQGIVTGGSVTVNGASALRRTINLTMISQDDENNIIDTNNIISINKKVKIEMGLKNPYLEYIDYGEIIWFPLGIYVITEANSSTTANSSTISIKGKDKMCMLDGTCGGTLPATVTFNEAQDINANGEITIIHPTIYDIIKECVHHYGEEAEQNIIINDLDTIAKQSVKYIGSEPIWFTEGYSAFQISDEIPENNDFTAHKFVTGQNIGYFETDYTYPGELVFEAGDSVTSVLDKIIQSLGNYEYFYDLDGHFIFQEKKNYLNHYYTPITELNSAFYVKAFSDTKYYHTFNDSKNSMSYTLTPRYENIKNDFIVWGNKTDSEGSTKNIKYHVAIDEKPIIDLAAQNLWERVDGQGNHLDYFCQPDVSLNYENVSNKPVELTITDAETEEQVLEKLNKYIENTYLKDLNNIYENVFDVYFKVYWKDEIRYYKTTINTAIEYTQPELVLYTSIVQQSTVITLDSYNYSASEEELLKNLNDYIQNIYLNTLNANQKDIFDVYFKIYWENKFRYYKIQIRNKPTYSELEYLELLTDSYKNKEIVIALSIPEEEIIEQVEIEKKEELFDSYAIYMLVYLSQWGHECVPTHTNLKTSDDYFQSLINERESWYNSLDEYNKERFLPTADLLSLMRFPTGYSWNNSSKDKELEGYEIIPRYANNNLLTDVVLIKDVNLNQALLNKMMVNNTMYEIQHKGIVVGFQGGALVEQKKTTWDVPGALMAAYIARYGHKGLGHKKYLAIKEARQRMENAGRLCYIRDKYYFLEKTNNIHILLSEASQDMNVYTTSVLYSYQTISTVGGGYTNFTIASTEDIRKKRFSASASGLSLPKNCVYVDLENGESDFGYYSFEKQKNGYEYEYIYYPVESSGKDLITTGVRVPTADQIIDYFQYHFWWWQDQENTSDWITPEEEFDGTYLSWITDYITQKVRENPGNIEALKYWWLSLFRQNTSAEQYFENWWNQYFSSVEIESSTDEDIEIDVNDDTINEDSGKKTINKNYKYVLLEMKEFEDEENKKHYELGYYKYTVDKGRVWVNVGGIADKFIFSSPQITYQELTQVLSNLNKKSCDYNQQYVRIFLKEDFQDEYNNLSIIDSTNLISSLNSLAPNQELYTLPDTFLTLVNLNVNFIYHFYDILDEEDINKIRLTAEAREVIIKNLVNTWRVDPMSFIEDVGLVIEAITDKNITNFTSIKEEDKIIFTVIDNTQANLIREYYMALPANQTSGVLINELMEYYYRNFIDFNTVPSQFILDITVYEPKDQSSSLDYSNNIYYKLIGRPCNEWREELYRQALLAKEDGATATSYDEELLAFWRDIFDTTNHQWENDWYKYVKKIDNFTEITIAEEDQWQGWNPAIYLDPSIISFWLELLDDDNLLSKYSINQIGRRTKAVKKDNIKLLYQINVPDVIFLENINDITLYQKIVEYEQNSQEYCVLKSNEMKYFTSSSTGSTAFDLIREMLYSNLVYNSSVNITCTPRYYLEPNNLIQINDKKSNIHGDFVITQFTLPLTYNGTMSISATESLVRV